MEIVSSINLGPELKSDVLTQEEIQMWKFPKSSKLFIDLLGPWIQITLALLLVALWKSPVAWVIAFFFIGGAQHGINLITHEFGHGHIFPKYKRLNDFFGTWLYGAPGGLPFRFYRDRHWDHHRYVSTPEDTKRLYRRDYTHWGLVKELFLGISGYDYFFQVWSVLSRHKQRVSSGENHRTYVIDFLAVIVVQFVIFGLFMIWGFWHYLFLWLLPLITASSLFAKLRSTAEHHPLKNEEGTGGYYLGTEVPLFRTVRATPLERLFLTRIDFHYHLEHHLWPSISYQNLSRAHARLYADKKFPEPPGYIRVLLSMCFGE